MTPSSLGAISKIIVRKPYSKPTLVRGPVISDVTAQGVSIGPKGA
jgi:hypothetical protein